jgi:hypothetical protein
MLRIVVSTKRGALRVGAGGFNCIIGMRQNFAASQYEGVQCSKCGGLLLPAARMTLT